MKITLLVEGVEDIAILRALLPPDLLDDCEFRRSGGRSTIISVARTFIIKHRAPIAILLDTDTVDPAYLIDMIRTSKHLVGGVAGDTPFDIVYFIPHIESVFFKDTVDLKRIFPECEKVYVRALAEFQPKEQLQLLFEKGGGPSTLHKFLDHLTSDEVTKIKSKGPIQQLLAFINNNRGATVRDD